MPSYDLICVSCRHEFERFQQRFLRAEDRVCPVCGAAEADIRLSVFMTARPARVPAEPRVTGFAGHGCCGGACAHH